MLTKHKKIFRFYNNNCYEATNGVKKSRKIAKKNYVAMLLKKQY